MHRRTTFHSWVKLCDVCLAQKRKSTETFILAGHRRNRTEAGFCHLGPPIIKNMPGITGDHSELGPTVHAKTYLVYISLILPTMFGPIYLLGPG